MLLGMWRKGKHCALLMGMEIGIATMENNIGITKNIKNRATIQSSKFISGYLPEETKNRGNEVGKERIRQRYVLKNRSLCLIYLVNLWKSYDIHPRNYDST